MTMANFLIILKFQSIRSKQIKKEPSLKLQKRIFIDVNMFVVGESPSLLYIPYEKNLSKTQCKYKAKGKKN